MLAVVRNQFQIEYRVLLGEGPRWETGGGLLFLVGSQFEWCLAKKDMSLKIPLPPGKQVTSPWQPSSL